MIKSLMIPLDHSLSAEQAVGPAASLARALNADVDLVLVHEQPKLANLRRSSWNDDQLNDESRYLESIANGLSRDGVPHQSHEVLHGEVVEALCKRASTSNADLIVMTSHGQTGFSKAHLGSVAYSLVRHTNTPILLLRDAEIARASQVGTLKVQRVIATYDGSDESRTILDTAAEFASGLKATLVLLQVVEPVPLFGAAMSTTVHSGSGSTPFVSGRLQDVAATTRLCDAARDELTNVKRDLLSRHDVQAECAVIVGSPVAGAIVDYANATGADVIAMSTHGRGISRWLLGSVVEGVLRSSNFPMLLARRPRRGATAVSPIASASLAEALRSVTAGC